MIENPLNKEVIFRIIDYVGKKDGISVLPYYIKKIIRSKLDHIDILLQSTKKNDNFIDGYFLCNKNKYIPLYFEPFIPDFSSKYFVFKSISKSISDIIIVTGDGDQDRPNLLKL